MQQLSLFGPERLPRRPYVTDNPELGITVRRAERALDWPYIQPNSPALKWRLVFDIDRPASVFAADEGNVAPPNWIAENPKNGHAHFAYEIAVPVVTSENGRADPLRFAAAVEHAYMCALGADRRYVGLICKNPLHENWRTHVQRIEAYDLAEMAEWVDLPKKLPKKELIESPLGRNVTIFDQLRHWAYRNVKRYENSLDWKFACRMQALAFNTALPVPLADNEVKHIVTSVAKWTWTRFDTDASDARFSALQSHRGTLSGQSRAAKANARAIEAKAMAAQGMTQKAIALALGVAQPTVSALLQRNISEP